MLHYKGQRSERKGIHLIVHRGVNKRLDKVEDWSVGTFMVFFIRDIRGSDHINKFLFFLDNVLKIQVESVLGFVEVFWICLKEERFEI